MRNRTSLLLSLRAALCLTIPLLVGIGTDQVRQATVFGLGALWGVSQDGLDAWPARSRRLLGLSLSVLVGFGIGATVGIWVPGSAARIAVLGVAGFASGYLQASGLASIGAYGLLGAVVASGIATTTSTWWMPLAASLGALWVWCVAAVMDRRSRHDVIRQCIADALDALARGVASIGRTDMFAARSAALRAIDVAQDAVGTRKPRMNVAEGAAIRQCMLIALHCGELVSYLAASTDPVPQIPELGELADLLRSGTARQAIARHREALARHTPPYPEPVMSALAIPTLEHATTWSPRPVAPFRPSPKERLRFGLLLGGCVALAMAVAMATRGPHGFWLPMSVAFILRPDLGPVIGRAAARTVGTLVGVGVAGLLALAGNPPIALIVLSCVMATLMPAATRKGHTLAVITFTPIVFVFIAMLGNDRGLFGPRILDTAIAALLVIVVDLVAWTTSPSLRPDAQIARAEATVSVYESCPPDTALTDRALMRRAAFRAIADAAAAQAMADREPAVLRRGSPTVHLRADALLGRLDQHTVALVQATR